MADFQITPDGHGFIVAGELDMSVAAEFAGAFGEILHVDGRVAGPISVDMRQLRFMDSSGVQTILAVARAAPDTCIVLHGVHDEVQKVVDLTGIDRLRNLHVMPCTVGVEPVSS